MIWNIGAGIAGCIFLYLLYAILTAKEDGIVGITIIWFILVMILFISSI